MINVLAKHRTAFLWVVILLIGLPLAIFFNISRTDPFRHGGTVAKLYGKNVSQVELDRGARMFELARDLGMSNFLQDLIGSAQTEQQAREQFAINLLILQHEAETLGLHPTPAETADALKNLPAFRGTDGFDLQRYNAAVQNYLGPRGFTETQLEELGADQVCLDRIKEILGTGATISEAESKTTLEDAYSKLDVSVIRLKPGDVANEIKIADDDIKKYYDANKEQLKSDETRKVQFIAITLGEEQKKLTGKQRVDALQKLSDQANDVSQALSEKGADFTAVAGKFSLPIVSTSEFSKAHPDPQLKGDAQLTATAFRLSQAEPTSEPVQTSDGFYVLHLVSVTPAKPLTLDEAKPKIVEALKTRQERELLSTRAAKIVHDLRDALKSGDALTNAAQKVGVKLEKIPPFELAEDSKASPAPVRSPDFMQIKQAVAELRPNEVSEPLPTNDGALIAILEKRTPPDEAQTTVKRAEINERILRGKRTVIFYEWLRERQRAAGVATAPAAAS